MLAPPRAGQPVAARVGTIVKTCSNMELARRAVPRPSRPPPERPLFSGRRVWDLKEMGAVMSLPQHAARRRRRCRPRAAAAHAEGIEGRWSLSLQGGTDIELSGNVHEGGSGTVLGLPTSVEARSFGDVYDPGFRGQAAIGYGIGPKSEVFLRGSYYKMSPRRSRSAPSPASSSTPTSPTTRSGAPSSATATTSRPTRPSSRTSRIAAGSGS
jgi:hypothetical protein